MDILTLARELREAADLVVADKDGRSLLLVEVKSGTTFEEESLSRLREDHRKFDFPFAMLINPAQIWVFGPDWSGEPVAKFATPETLRPCDPYFDDHKSLSRDYLVHVAWSWLFDFVSVHRPDRPPQPCCLQKVGLADRLVGGEVMTEDMLFKPLVGLERSI